MSYRSTAADLKRIAGFLEERKPEDTRARVLHELRIEMLNRAADVLLDLIDETRHEAM